MVGPCRSDDDLSVLSRLGYSTPSPLEPNLSSDGMTLYNAGLPVVYVANPEPSHEPVRVPPLIDLLTAPESATSTFSITYAPNGTTDPWGETCYTFPSQAQTSFSAAANVWANIIQSSVPIRIRACWANLGSSSILGYSGGGSLYRNFSGAPRANTWYTKSLANALTGTDLDPANFDMHITYNLNFSWYYGTDGNTPAGQYDLMSVVLHEIAHGLNFSGSMSYSAGSGSWGYGTGYPNIYDTWMRDGSGNQLINTGVYPNPSGALGSALTSNNIWFHGGKAMAANGGVRVKIYAPSSWSGGSSYSHLDYTTFNDTLNELMVYAFSSGESVHDPGPVTKGLLEDLGWHQGLVDRTRRSKVDFDGDRKTDIAVYRVSTGAWYIKPSSGTSPYGIGWGGDPTDKPVPGDYDGDGKTDIAIYRTSTGAWYIKPSSGTSPYGIGWGGDPTDKPVPGDYDGDGKADIAVYRGSNGAWYIIPSSPPSTPYGVGWGGEPTDKPVPGDYDGDGKTDVAIYRPTNGGWYIIPSSSPSAPYGVGWGGSAFKPVPGDYDGDGKADIAIYDTSSGAWWIIPSSGTGPQGQVGAYGVGWGGSGFTPVTGDYDGDGKTDIAIWRPEDGYWYIINSKDGSITATQWGAGYAPYNDEPISQ